MKKMHIAELFAVNLEFAIDRKYGRKPDGSVNQSKFAADAKVSQKSISNYLSANKQENKPHLDKISLPSLPILCRLAKALEVEPWQLLHHDIGISQQAIDVAKAFDRLPVNERPLIMRALGLTVDEITEEEEVELMSAFRMAEPKDQANILELAKTVKKRKLSRPTKNKT